MDKENTESNQKALKSDLGLVSALALVVGMVLGVGAFMKPPAVLGLTGADSTMAMLAWIIGGFLSIVGGLTLCELGVLFPRTGGLYVFMEEIYNKKVAFLYGWMMSFFYGPAVVGALAGYFSAVFCLIFAVPENYTVVVALTVLSFVLFINSVGVKEAGYLQTIATSCKLIPVALLIVFGLWKGEGTIFLQAVNSNLIVAPFSLAILSTLFAYDGWAQVATVAGELKNPKKILPQAIIGGLIFLILAYVVINLAFLKVIPAEQMVALGHDASAIIAQKLFGINGGNILAVGIMISILGGLNGYVMIVSRIFFAMAEKKQIPFAETISKIDKNSGTPTNATILLVSLAFLFFQVLDADKLADTAIFTIWIFYLLSFIGVMILRFKKPDLERVYKVPLYPVVPILAILGAIYIIVGMLWYETWISLSSIAVTLLGLPVIYILSKKDKWTKLPFLQKKYAVLVVCCLVIGFALTSIKIFDNRPVIKVALEASNQPVAFYDQKIGELNGFAVELMNEIAKEAGYKIKFVPISFENLFDSIEKGLADVAIGQLTITEKRKEKVVFSKSISQGNLVLLFYNDDKVKSIEDIDDKILVKKGTTAESYLKEKYINKKIMSVNDNEDVLRLFKSHEADALVIDSLLVKYWLNSGLLTGCTVIDLSDSNAEFAFALKKDNHEINKKIDEKISALKNNGLLEKLLQKWYDLK